MFFLSFFYNFIINNINKNITYKNRGMNLENDLNINYNITEVKTNLVLQLGNNDRLNNIISKYFFS